MRVKMMKRDRPIEANGNYLAAVNRDGSQSDLTLPRWRNWTGSPFSERCGRIAAVLISANALILMWGCATLPDVTPYVEASGQLSVSLRCVGRTAVHQMNQAAAAALEQNQDKLKGMARELEVQWANHVDAMDAASAYARSVQEVAEAGNTGAESARKVADAALNLAQKADFAVGQAGSLAADAFVSIYKQIARARARTRLIESMQTAQPAIEGAMNLLALSLEDLREIVLDMAALRINSLRRNLSDELRFRATLILARDAVYESKAWDSMSPEEKANLKETEEAVRETDKWYLPLEEQQRLILTERDAAVEAITASAQGVRDWAAMHNRLLDSIEQGSGIDVTELQIMIGEIGHLVERMRESRAPIASE